MKAFIAIIVVLLTGGAIYFFTRSKDYEPMPGQKADMRALVPFEGLFRKIAKDTGEDIVDWKLLAAHASVESSYRPKAFNAEGSSGLMQILLPLSKNRGANRHVQDGNLPEFESIDTAKIFDPEYNITLGCALIRENIREYGMPRAIAVYESDSARGDPQFGPFVNQSYVNKVQSVFDKLKADTGE